jgi:hypothetical protein
MIDILLLLFISAPTPLLTTTSNVFTYPPSTDIPDQSVLAEEVSSRPRMSDMNDVDYVSTRPEMSDLTDSSTAHFIISSPPNADVSRDIRNSFSHRGGMSVSNSTVETFIPTTPSEGESFQKNFKMMMEKNNCVLQPHQGRKPTVERNTHKRSDEEIVISGNTLVYGNEIFDLENNMSSINDNLLENVNDNLETSLVQSDVLNMNTRHVHAPIPYLQNQVHRTDMGTRPKNANIINAGNNTTNKLNNVEAKKPFFTRLFGSRGFNPLGIFHLGSKSSGKSDSSGNVQSQNSEIDSGVQLNERSSNLNHRCLNSGPRPFRNLEHRGETSGPRPYQHSAKPSNCNITEQNGPQNLIVSLQNGKPVIKPTNIMLSNQMRTDTSDESSEPDDQQLPNLNDQIGIARMEMFRPQKLKLVIKGQDNSEQYSKSTSDLSPLERNKEFDDCGMYKLRRPDSLKLKGHNYKDKEWNQNSSQTYPQKNTRDKRLNIKRRVKTPIKVIKHGRFSLYDDRLMSQIVNDSPIENNYFKKTSASMNQIKKCCDDNANSINVAMVTDHIC